MKCFHFGKNLGPNMQGLKKTEFSTTGNLHDQTCFC